MKKQLVHKIKLTTAILSVMLLFCVAHTHAQNRSLGRFELDETELYAMTKQVSQFFSRFNNEEDQFGKKYHPQNPEFRNPEKRRIILPLLFDNENKRTSGTLKDFFVEDLVGKGKSNYLEFLGGRWYAEVAATFVHQGRDVNIILFLMIEKENLGSKWVLTNVYYPEFNKLFPKGELAEREKHFLHPMSHELDFMNIYKAFNHAQVIDFYASKEFQPDYLTLFFAEIKAGRMKFKSVDQLKFHIFQVKDWYFEVSYLNRKGTNSGWLITNLVYMTEKEKPAFIKLYEPWLSLDQH
jgi:hypothetical protein